MLDQMGNEIKLISGSSHPELSAKVASRYVVMRQYQTRPVSVLAQHWQLAANQTISSGSAYP
jgi:hypothetical protein